jgi:hypothetical protein
LARLASADLLTALEKREFLPRVSADFAGGVLSCLNGTPTFFINGQSHDPPFEYGDLVAAIQGVVHSKRAFLLSTQSRQYFVKRFSRETRLARFSIRH